MLAAKTDQTLPPNQQDRLETQLLQHRKLFLWGPVEENSARQIVAGLTLLEAEDPHKEIILYINSPGGVLSDGLAIYDAMQATQPAISTVVVGMAASAGALIQAGGAPGRRFAWPHARLMIHQPLATASFEGPATDVSIQAQEFLKSRDLVNQLWAKHANQPLEKVRQDTDRNYWMSAEEAQQYGFVDQIITTMTPEPVS